MPTVAKTHKKQPLSIYQWSGHGQNDSPWVRDGEAGHTDWLTGSISPCGGMGRAQAAEAPAS